MKRSALTCTVSLALLLLLSSLSAAAQDTRVVPPPNDNIASATAVSARGLMKQLFTVAAAEAATLQSGEPIPSCATGSMSKSIWYKLVPPYDVELIADTFESSLNNGASNNTVIAVYTSSSASPTMASLHQLYCAEGGTGAGSFTWLPLAAGTYYLQVGSSVTLTSVSTYKVQFGSRYQLLTNTSFGTSTAVLAPWTVTNKTSDKVACDVILPRFADSCAFRFKVSAAENSILTYKLPGMSSLPHDTGPTNYSEFDLTVDYYTERAQTNATATITVKFSDGTKRKGSRSLDQVGAIFVDPLNGTTPTSASVKIKHTGHSGQPLYITNVKLYYAPGATGRSAALPVPRPRRNKPDARKEC